MAEAKDIRVERIPKREAVACVRRWHYSGKPYVKSHAHYGVFLDGSLLGAMQFGPSIDVHKAVSIVPGTALDGYLELNRMAFSDALPRNSESRALGIVFRDLRRTQPGIEWIVSYSDATQCGDGAIYRAAGMLLTQIRRNSTLWTTPGGAVVSDIGIRTSAHLRRELRCGTSRASFISAGLVPLVGYQMRYMKFMTRDAASRYKGRILGYDDIPPEAKMVRGARAQSSEGGPPGPPAEGVRSDHCAPEFHQGKIL